MTAYSPTGRPLGCPVSEENGTFYASFQPDEAGEWRIHVTYDERDIENSPFRCMAFDPRAVFVSGATKQYPTNSASVNLVMGCSKVFSSCYSNSCPGLLTSFK